MQTTRLGDLELSQLMLGTVQFGLPYGIANKAGQPEYADVKDIIACAHNGGVNCLDTAAAYGESEEVIGRVLADLGIADEMVIATKILAMNDELSPGPASDEFVERSAVESLERLNREVLDICLFHREENFKYIDSLLKLKNKGLVKHIGVSVMTPEAALEIVRSGVVDAIQIPTCILDHRYIRSGVIKAAVNSGVAVFVRSIYLQGLVLMPENDIPSELAQAIPVRRKLQVMASEWGLSIAELALRYVLSITEMSCAVIGVDSRNQMENNLDLLGKGPLDAVLIDMINSSVPKLSDDVLMPNKWLRRTA